MPRPSFPIVRQFSRSSTLLEHQAQRAHSPSVNLAASQIVPLLDMFAVKRKSENDNVGQRLKNMGLTHLFRHPQFGSTIFNKQIELEVNAVEKAVSRYNKDLSGLVQRGVGAGTQPASQLIRQWFEPLKAAIEEEQAAIVAGDLFKVETEKIAKFTDNEKVKLRHQQHLDRCYYGPYLLLLPAEKLAVITLNEIMSATMQNPEGETVAKVVMQIAQSVEVECALHKKRVDMDDSSPQSTLTTELTPFELKRRKAQMSKLKKSRDVKGLLWYVKRQKVWGPEVRAKVGGALVALLLQSTKIDSPNGPQHAFIHCYQWRSTQRRYGVIKPHALVLRSLEDGQVMSSFLFPQYMPMLVQPIPWVAPNLGGFLTLPCKLMRTKSSERQNAALRESRHDIADVYNALNVLGETKWAINEKMMEIIQKVWNEDGRICDIPPRTDLELPPEPIRPPGTTEEEWKIFSARHARQCNEIEKENRERVSLRADFLLKLDTALQFRKEEFHFPHNIDFRGRAYPIPPHLNHLGSDVCRAMLTFAKGKRLGRRGLQWLKVHLSGLCGHNKMPFSEREKWTESNLKTIFDVALDPMGASKSFWMQADEPWQALATCIELHAALTSALPEDFVSKLPVHQDGSCNGLQHYAALGRDYFGAQSVNMTPSEKPGDPYSAVARTLAVIVAEEAKAGNKFAKELDGKISRKIVKQTVMTSVYGVTFIGARNQIQGRLKDLESIPESMLYPCASYLAQKTLRALNDTFVGLKNTKTWLADLAKTTAKLGYAMEWKTPLGLPVVQPYRSLGFYRVDTVVQKLSLVDNNDSRPPLVRKQSSAFPPNFIHSLDATHMMLTANACSRAGLTFAGVHDSFWTHACDVDEMSKLLREQFIALHSYPILENLLSDAQKLVGDDNVLCGLPERGDYDVSLVRDSPFFFS